ncbi:hypothetical protein BHM03_00057762 [Ensete ventricosum]|nr:hypothetical protein BHM03_00057762 [Ensete ventricosum]
MGSRTSTLSQKNTTVINFARSRALSRVSICFSSTVPKIQNTGQSQRISPCDLLCLGLRLRLRSALGTATSSLGRFLLYDSSTTNTSVEGRRSLLRSAIPGRESAISGVEGQRLFSPRCGTDSRARNDGGCAAIGAGFTAALRSCGNSSVERATAVTLVWAG